MAVRETLMADGDSSSSYQRLLSEYLQCELDHALGAYRVAGERLADLVAPLKRLQSDSHGEQERSEGGEEPSRSGKFKSLLELVQIAKTHNVELSEYRYATVPMARFGRAAAEEPEEGGRPARDPIPRELPVTDWRRFELDPGEAGELRKPVGCEHPLLRDVTEYYRAAIHVLRNHDPAAARAGSSAGAAGGMTYYEENFAASILAPRDGVSASYKEGQKRRRLDRRQARYRHRYEEAEKWLGKGGTNAKHGGAEQGEHDPAFLRRVATGNLSTPGDSLARVVLNAQAEAHLSMHAVEAWTLMCLGGQAEFLGADEDDWLKRELERSIALSTFAYCASRTAPWLFAKDRSEWAAVFDSAPEAWENVVPAHCMWIATQVSLLALHRRAYARALKRDAEGAYNDYHKLHQLIRDAERRVGLAPIRVDGSLEFLEGLSAEAHHHIGELYRSEHAHKPALEHFEAASHRLGRLQKRDSAKAVLVDSRWNVQLQISRGKACYELGKHKEALTWYLHAWQAFLQLLAEESQTEASTDPIEQAIAWLDDVKFEPELRKAEVSEQLRPVVEQLDRISAVGPLGALAAEILLRLGHLLFVLNVAHEKLTTEALEDRDAQPEESKGKTEEYTEGEAAEAREQVMRTLAMPCLAKAAECDPYCTLVGADMLKARFRFSDRFRGALPAAYSAQLEPPDLMPVGQQWPRGGEDYERLARVAEYLILAARVKRFEESAARGANAAADDAIVARDLLLSLFMSTDSINVRKSQIHRFLMEPRNDRSLPHAKNGPAIEFVCMRRYSSPFPLLPRPSAFRSLGGGYFVRLHADGEPFGVVVDPGVDFVENLYRARFALSDIDMIVVTHDHVDHLGALDPLLSLLHVRGQLLAHEEKRSRRGEKRKRVRILVSESVMERYASVDRLRHSKLFEFECFEGGKPSNGLPGEFELVFMSSERGAPPEEDGSPGGHRDLSGKPSHGMCLRTKGKPGPSLAITSDTPPPPREGEDGYEKRYEEWSETWGPALESDLLVVHLSSVPLTELRRMDREADKELSESSRGRCQSIANDQENLEKFRERLQNANENLRGQIEYAQWLRSHHGGSREEKLTAPLVGTVPAGWLPPTEHNYLGGLLTWARRYEGKREEMAKSHADEKGRKADRQAKDEDALPPQDMIRPLGLFVIGELSEELGTMRGKVATRLSQRLFEGDRRRRDFEAGKLPEDGKVGLFGALSADIGLQVCITSDESAPQGTGSKTKILCTTCDLDTDRAPEERFHFIHNVFEVCVKGENEGIFYNCVEHDPTRQEDPTFLERLERFDIFGR